MRAFDCVCGQPLFFDNTSCLNCGREVGYDPTRRELGATEPAAAGGAGLRVRAGEAGADGATFRACAGRAPPVACNWLVPSGEAGSLCLACRLTRTVPPMDRPRNPERLRRLEAAKRRVVAALQGLELELAPKSEDPGRGLAFDLLEALPGRAVLTGHADGVVTLNVAEADDDYRERNRATFAEPYRTLVGHIRHELGHYYWDRLVAGTPWLTPFRELFGDERADYGQALRRHYAEGPPAGWRARFMSAYAAAHPWEDWAETWAHFLHMRATLETVTSFKLDTSRTPIRTTAFGPDALYRNDPGHDDDERFLDWVNAWVVLTAVLNEVARSMGQPDIYPFVLNAPVVAKLHFVHRLTTDRLGAGTPAVPGTLATPAPAG